jgi:hypothetical protein
VDQATIERICQLVIDSDILEPYYHADTDPNRKPLHVVESTTVRPGLRLTKFGQPVRIAPREELVAQQRPFLEFTKVEVRGDKAEVEFSYPVEGVVGTVALDRRNGAWTIGDKRLRER